MVVISAEGARRPMRVLLLLLTALLSGCLADAGRTDDDLQAEPGAPAAVRKVHEQRFEGTAPAPEPGKEAVYATFPVPVPQGAARVLVTYNTTYTGLGPSYGFLTDTDGTERASTGDSCASSLSVDVLESHTCAFEVRHGLEVGAGTFRLSFQAGEVAEAYSVDVAVWGRV